MTTIATLSPLSSPEQRKLAQCVDDILQGMGPQFVRLGLALMKIRDHRLFRKDAGINEKRAKPLLLCGKPLTVDQRFLYRMVLEENGKISGEWNPWAVSAALKMIRDERLYREQADSFEEFCMFSLALDEKAAADFVNWDTPKPVDAIVEKKARQPSCVYFIECLGHDLVKIGFSDDHLKTRFCDLQISSPFELRIVATIPGATRKVEGSLHEKFIKLWVRGEWFRYDDDIRQFIVENAKPYHGGHRWQLT